MTKVTTYIESGRTFYICKDENGYWGIEDKNIDENGKLAVKLNGISGHLKNSVADCIRSISFQIKLDDLLTQGYDLNSAFQKMWQMA